MNWFSVLVSIYDKVTLLGLDYIPGVWVAPGELNGDTGWVLGGLDGNSVLVQPEGLNQPKAGRGWILL